MSDISDDFVTPVTRLETVTPHMAATWLAMPTDRSRLTDRAVVERLALNILRDVWMPGEHEIVFNKDGQLIAGQTALFAIWEARKAVQCYVTRLDIDVRVTEAEGPSQ